MKASRFTGKAGDTRIGLVLTEQEAAIITAFLGQVTATLGTEEEEIAGALYELLASKEILDLEKENINDHYVFTYLKDGEKMKEIKPNQLVLRIKKESSE